MQCYVLINHTNLFQDFLRNPRDPCIFQDRADGIWQPSHQWWVRLIMVILSSCTLKSHHDKHIGIIMKPIETWYHWISIISSSPFNFYPISSSLILDFNNTFPQPSGQNLPNTPKVLIRICQLPTFPIFALLTRPTGICGAFPVDIWKLETDGDFFQKKHWIKADIDKSVFSTWVILNCQVKIQIFCCHGISRNMKREFSDIGIRDGSKFQPLQLETLRGEILNHQHEAQKKNMSRLKTSYGLIGSLAQGHSSNNEKPC